MVDSSLAASMQQMFDTARIELFQFEPGVKVFLFEIVFLFASVSIAVVASSVRSDLCRQNAKTHLSLIPCAVLHCQSAVEWRIFWSHAWHVLTVHLPGWEAMCNIQFGSSAVGDD